MGSNRFTFQIKLNNMVDLSTYRARIGQFHPKYGRRHKIRSTTQSTYVRTWLHLFSSMRLRTYSWKNEGDPPLLNSKKLALVLLVVYSLSAWLPSDDRYGKNRQRFPFESDEEKTLFNNIRTLDSKVVRAKSHLKFFTDCHMEGLRPINLEYNGNFNLAFADTSINEKLKAIDNQNIEGKMMLCINHFKLCSTYLTEELTTAKERLRDTVSLQRYSYLITQLDNFRKPLERKLEITKSNKIRKLQAARRDSVHVTDNSNGIWVSNLKIADRLAILNNQLLTDAHITTSMDILSKNHPIMVQPPSVFLANGYDYCPFETIQIAHNSALHWVLLSSMKGVVSIYDSLQMKPTESLLLQIKQLFSPDDALPAIKEMSCRKQLGGADCGVFAIAYAVDILEGNNPERIRYEQTKMRKHLVECLEAGKFTPFPRYRNTDDEVQSPSRTRHQSQSQGDSWITPKRYNLRSQSRKGEDIPTVVTSNQYSALSEDYSTHQPGEVVSKQIEETTKKDEKHQISSVVHNISNSILTKEEMKLLEKGLNFCPSSKNVNKEELLDDVFAYTRNVRLKYYFNSLTRNSSSSEQTENTSSNGSNSSSSQQSDNTSSDGSDSQDIEPDDERCEMKTVYKNPFFDPPANYSTPNLENYLAATKSDILRLSDTPSNYSTNMSTAERITLDSLRKRSDIVITSADKGGKIVVLDKEEYPRVLQDG